MAQKRINNVNAGVRRPLRLSDLQDIWDGMTQALALGTSTTPRIISGFESKGDGTLSAGVVAFQNILYFHADTSSSRIPIGANVYVREISAGDMRFFADGTEQIFSFDRVAGTVPDGGTLIGAFTLANVNAWRSSFVADGSVTTSKLADGAVTSQKIADGAVTTSRIGEGVILTNHLYNAVVTTEKIAARAVTAEKIADGTITVEKMAAQSVWAGTLTRPLAPCIFSSPPLDHSMVASISGNTIHLDDLLTYDVGNGVWKVRPIRIISETIIGSYNTLYLSGTLRNPANHIMFPSLITIIVNYWADGGTLQLNCMSATNAGGIYAPSHVRPIQPQGGWTATTWMKGSTGFTLISSWEADRT